MKVRRFAEGTKVPASKTRIEIDRLLEKHGASQRLVFTDDDRGVHAVAFAISGRQVRFELPCSPDDGREERRVWRALLLVLKAKLELIAGGDSSVDIEFLPNIVLPDGSKVSDRLVPQIAEAYETGHMPPLLPAAGGTS